MLFPQWINFLDLPIPDSKSNSQPVANTSFSAKALAAKSRTGNAPGQQANARNAKVRRVSWPL